MQRRERMPGAGSCRGERRSRKEGDQEVTVEDRKKAEKKKKIQAKIIVRSNGTVTYVGKDIAYQLWKFGLLGKDFHYRRWPDAPGRHELWATTGGENEPGAPRFGGATAVST